MKPDEKIRVIEISLNKEPEDLLNILILSFVSCGYDTYLHIKTYDKLREFEVSNQPQLILSDGTRVLNLTCKFFDLTIFFSPINSDYMAIQRVITSGNMAYLRKVGNEKVILKLI